MLKGLGIDLIPASAPDFFTADTPTAVLVRQVLGAIAQFEKASLVAKLKAARDRKRAREGKCEGRRSQLEDEAGARGAGEAAAPAESQDGPAPITPDDRGQARGGRLYEHTWPAVRGGIYQGDDPARVIGAPPWWRRATAAGPLSGGSLIDGPRTAASDVCAVQIDRLDH